MGKLALFGLVGPPASRQNHGTKGFAFRIHGQDVVFALVVFHEFFMQLLRIQFLAFLIHFHLVRKRKRNIEFNFLTRFFQGDDKITRLAGNSSGHRLRLHRNTGGGFHFLYHLCDNR